MIHSPDVDHKPQKGFKEAVDVKVLTPMISSLLVVAIVVIVLSLGALCADAQTITIQGRGFSISYGDSYGPGWYGQPGYAPGQPYWQPPTNRRDNDGYSPRSWGCSQQGGYYNPYDARERELRRQDKILRAKERVLREQEDVAEAYAKWQGLRYSPDHSSERAFVRWQRDVVAAERNLLRQQDDLAEAERTLREASWTW